MRLPDWKSRLIDYLNDVDGKPYALGTHDCALFAAGAVATMTGDDMAAPFRGRYRTLKGGLSRIRKAGFDDHIALAQSRFAQVHPAYVAPGDLAVVDTGDGPALGVVQGEGIYVLGLDRLGVTGISDARLFLKVD
jgi:hypothetical protein